MALLTMTALTSPVIAARGTTPEMIAGGPFEPSGVIHVPGSDQVLFVDDGRHREIFSMAIAPDGRQAGPVVAVPLNAAVTDLEGITSDGQFVYVVGSQSKNSGFDGDGLVRFKYDATLRRVESVERIAGLKAWLAAHVPELRGTAQRIGDDVLNIEALAWDPRHERLLLGLRAPVVGGHALIIPVRMRSGWGSFTRDGLEMAGPTIRLSLGGAGIRSLEYDSRAAAYRIITGAGLNTENRDFHLLEWDGASTVRELATFSSTLKPEGIANISIAGTDAHVIVFDTGRFLLFE